ncbi:UxaA family hydrolase [candidate division KSB1 bacterium]
MSSDLKDSVLLINEKDNIIVALKKKRIGDTIKLVDKVIDIKDEIPAGHKIAITMIKKYEAVIKYGESIGIATKDITPGEWVHSHNLESTRARGDKRK